MCRPRVWVGEVVPAREGLRPLLRRLPLLSRCCRRSGSSKRRIKTNTISSFGVPFTSRRSGSSKRRIKTSEPNRQSVGLGVGEVVPAREGLRQDFQLSGTLHFPLVGEVVPAREGLRLHNPKTHHFQAGMVGEVVPAREGLRPLNVVFQSLFRDCRRSGSSKRRIKTCSFRIVAASWRVGEVVPAREGLRLFFQML